MLQCFLNLLFCIYPSELGNFPLDKKKKKNTQKISFGAFYEAVGAMINLTVPG